MEKFEKHCEERQKEYGFPDVAHTYSSFDFIFIIIMVVFIQILLLVLVLQGVFR